MRTVLGVMGSPRKKGNTEVLVSRILDGARDGGANTSIISLGELEIQECVGCHACWKGKHECCKNDDMKDLDFTRLLKYCMTIPCTGSRKRPRSR